MNYIIAAIQKLSLVIFVLCIFTVTSQAQPQHVKELSSGNLLIEDFENAPIGGLPERWYNQKGTGQPADYNLKQRETYEYEVLSEDGNKFLRFNGMHGKHLNFPTLEVDNINLNTHPILSWRWRVHQIPENGNEDTSSRNDVAASIYVVFEMRQTLFKKLPQSIVYTWSSTLEPGTELSHFFGNKKTIVVKSGCDDLDKWVTFERNIAEDYRRLFEKEPPQTPVAILILSDGNDTRSQVIADYDDIRLLKSKSDSD